MSETPVENIIEPESPFFTIPVVRYTPPLCPTDPLVLFPVCRTSVPLASPPELLALATATSPLESTALLPLDIIIFPPLPRSPFPDSMTTFPPRLPWPAMIDAAPPFASRPEDAPAPITIDPASPTLADPADTVTSPDDMPPFAEESTNEPL